MCFSAANKEREAPELPELRLSSSGRKVLWGMQPLPSPSENQAPRNSGLMNQNINSLTPSALHDVMIQNTNNKNHKTMTGYSFSCQIKWINTFPSILNFDVSDLERNNNILTFNERSSIDLFYLSIYSQK